MADARSSLHPADRVRVSKAFCGYYGMAKLRSRQSAFTGSKRAEGEKAAGYFASLSEDIAALRSVDNSRVLALIHWKAVTNSVNVQWNAAPSSQRDGTEMCSLIARTSYFERLVEQQKVLPKDFNLSFNALAIASRFRRDDKYSELYAALKRAKPDFLKIQEFNEDFDDFRAWLASNSNTLKGSKQCRIDQRRHLPSHFWERWC